MARCDQSIPERGTQHRLPAAQPAQAGDIAQPTADELSKYFEARKILTESHEISTVQVTPLELGKWMDISDADIKAAYEEHHNRYIRAPSRRADRVSKA